MKKKFSVIFIFLISIVAFSMFSGLFKVRVFAEHTLAKESKSAFLVDAYSDTVIYEKNANERLPIASMCKVMTLVLCFDKIQAKEIDFSDVVVVSENASGMGGSQVFLEANGEYLVGELIKSIVVASANDACVAMAERLYGSESIFVEKMNEKAKELGMENTCFVNCTGLPKPGQYSCAQDVAKMFSCLIKNQEYFRFSKIWTDVVKHPKNNVTEISNTNKLIRFYKGCDGGKTGFTSEAGHCLVASAIRNDVRLISVIIKAPDSKTRFKEASDMFNYGFANYTNKLVVDDKTPLSLDISVCGGKKDKLEVVAEKPFYLFNKRDEKRSVNIDFEPFELIKAPVEKGQMVGCLKIYENGVLIGSVNVVANENVEMKTYFDYINDIGSNWAII